LIFVNTAIAIRIHNGSRCYSNEIDTKVMSMTRIALAIAPLATILCFALSPAKAQTYGNAPWCAVRELGTGEVQWDCQYASAAECAPTVVAGNRGFCNVNPYLAWARPPGPQPLPVRPHRRHHRHY
jgi:hypothetical protein